MLLVESVLLGYGIWEVDIYNTVASIGIPGEHNRNM